MNVTEIPEKVLSCEEDLEVNFVASNNLENIYIDFYSEIELASGEK